MNIVGTLYVRLMNRFVRGRRAGRRPADVEAGFAEGRRGIRPRRAVVSLLSYYVLEICVACIVPSLALVLVARAHSGAAVHDAALAFAALIATIPLGLFLGLFVWSVLPGSSPRSYYAEPAALLPASILAWIGWLGCATLMWLSLRT